MRGGARWFDGSGARLAEVLNDRQAEKAELAGRIRWCSLDGQIDGTRVLCAILRNGDKELNYHQVVVVADVEAMRDGPGYIANLLRTMQGRLIQTAMGER